jgi:hypothetical protein
MSGEHRDENGKVGPNWWRADLHKHNSGRKIKMNEWFGKRLEKDHNKADIVFVNTHKAKNCDCVVEYSNGGGEYSDVIYVWLCDKHKVSVFGKDVKDD